MRISRADLDDPTGKRRRHFEISIDSPFTVLNCRATQANTALPQYSGSDGPIPERREQVSCGCPDAQPLDPTSSMLSRPLTMVEEDIVGFSGRRLNLDRPSARSRTNTGQSLSNNTSTTSDNHNNARPETISAAQTDRLRQNRPEQERPIHLIRHPSHNPPAFDADEPPPQLPLQTPPPQYDLIVGTPSVDGLADYFARLAAYEGEGGVSGADDGVGLGVGLGVAGGFPGLDAPPPAAESSDGTGSRQDADADSDTNTIGPDNADTDATPESEVPSLPVSVAPSAAQSQETLNIADAASANPTTTNPPAISSTEPTTALITTLAATAPALNPEADIDPFSTLSLPINPAAQPLEDTITTSSSSDSEDEEDDFPYTQDGRTRLHRGGRVNVANPRTPGGRLVPSRSLEIERPSVRLDMSAVLLRRGGRG